MTDITTLTPDFIRAILNDADAVIIEADLRGEWWVLGQHSHSAIYHMLPDGGAVMIIPDGRNRRRAYIVDNWFAEGNR